MPLTLPPSAFMGYSPDFATGKVFVKVCAWCADKEQAEREAAREGCQVTHGICKNCFQKQMAQRLGERAD